MRFFIDIVDRDYRSWVGTEELVLSSWKDAEKYCKDNTWSGTSYHIDKAYTKCGKMFRYEHEYIKWLEKKD